MSEGLQANPVRLRLPASSANLGSGFDAAAVALDFYLDIKAAPAEEFSIEATGCNREHIARLENNLVLEIYKGLLETNGRPVIPLAIRMNNEIPLGMGCGSSAAGRLAAIALAVHFGRLGWSSERILEEASALEGHPDNASACWLGGFVAAACEGNCEERRIHVARVAPPAAFAIDAKDHYTRDHSRAVSRLAVQIAREMALPEMLIEEVRLGGIVHDIGKIGVPEAVLNKPGRLTAEEYDLMKTHAVLGAKILEPLKVRAIEHIRRMVRHHHEMVDGTGYPDRLKGESIPLGARIITVADCFDTMTTDREYKRGRTFDEAMEELYRCSGTQFDPDIVKAFARCQEIPTACAPSRTNRACMIE